MADFNVDIQKISIPQVITLGDTTHILLVFSFGFFLRIED